MPKENNKMQVDIDTLKKQNVNDLLSIKELYNRIEELGEKITQIKYIDNTLVKKIKKEYESLKKTIFDENAILNLDSKIDETKSLLQNKVEKAKTEISTNINEINTQLTNIVNKQEVYVTDFGADSSGNNDSCTQIQQAIDYAYTNNKKTVVFSEGRYKITNGFKFRGGIKYYSPNNGAIIFIDDGYIGTSEGILNNYNGVTVYNEESADSFEIENLTFLYDSALKFDSKTFLLLKNVNGVNINKCKFIQNKKLTTFETEITNIDLYACCKNVNITNCEFTILSDTLAGGNIWIRNFAVDNEELSNLTENIVIDNCKFLKKAHDEMIAVFNVNGGSIKNVVIKNNNFKMLESTSISPICLAFRASGKTFTENVTFENNYVDIDNFSFHVLETNRGTGLLKNCNITNNTFYIRTTTSSNTFFNYGTGPTESVNINNNTIYFIKENDNYYPVSQGVKGVNNANNNYIYGYVKEGIYDCDNACNNIIELRNEFNGIGCTQCRNIINNIIKDVYTGIKILGDENIFIQNNRITLSDKELSTSFMFQGTTLNTFTIIKDNFIDKIEGTKTNLRYLSMDKSPNIKVSFENNKVSENLNFYSPVIKLYYARNNLIGTISDTFGGIPNYRVRDILPVGHEVFDPTTSKKYIKITDTNNSNEDWKEINMTLI